MDDSQWLVTVFSHPADGNISNDSTDNNILKSNQLLFPQTKYKIYTNFVDSIPEGYFYYRSDKQMEFEYYDFYTNDLLDNGSFAIYEGKNIIPRRDVLVKCKIYDVNDLSCLKNLVPIKYYKYTVGEVDI